MPALQAVMLQQASPSSPQAMPVEGWQVPEVQVRVLLQAVPPQHDWPSPPHAPGVPGPGPVPPLSVPPGLLPPPSEPGLLPPLSTPMPPSEPDPPPEAWQVPPVQVAPWLHATLPQQGSPMAPHAVGVPGPPGPPGVPGPPPPGTV